MKKIKYYYNTRTLRYEKLVTPLRVKLLKFFGFVTSALVTALILVSLAFRFIPSPQAKIAEAKYEKMSQNYEALVSQARLLQLEDELALLLVPKDPRDDSDLFLEVRAGTGGDEAAIFAGDLFRMYARYAERQGWKVEVESASPGEHGGYKEIVARVEGRGAYSKLKFESGTHRVQRVPDTESQGRIHTSAATVAIIAEDTSDHTIEINPADLKVDTFRSSGAGGQHVNKTESAIRITHVPSGVVVESQTERSQHANRDKAMKRLKAMLVEAEIEKRAAVQAADRKLQVGSGDRSQRIRTYNYPQGRITDHRVEGLTLYDLPNVLEGNLDALLERLAREQQADELARLGSD